jgi:hypothetical protein
MLIDRWQHVSECLICRRVSKYNVNETVQIILGAFVNWLETAAGFVISIRLSVHISWLVYERFFVKICNGDFMKIS